MMCKKVSKFELGSLLWEAIFICGLGCRTTFNKKQDVLNGLK